MSRKSEREAARKANQILARAGGKGSRFVDGESDVTHGSGRMTEAQRRSQETYIPLTPAPQTAGQKAWRNLFG